MLAVGRALLAAPSLLLLDEPSEGLAPLVVRDLGRRIRQLSEKGLGVLVTEQNYLLALEIASRVYFMERGSVAWEGPSSEASRRDILLRYLGV
jgi:branched-chain amino acid transport system ATP-binding protein